MCYLACIYISLTYVFNEYISSLSKRGALPHLKRKKRKKINHEKLKEICHRDRRTKHIEIDIHFVREKVALREVLVLHVPTSAQFAHTSPKGFQQQPSSTLALVSTSPMSPLTPREVLERGLGPLLYLYDLPPCSCHGCTRCPIYTALCTL